MNYKGFYSNYNNGFIIYDGNRELIKRVGTVGTVFEFGCGTGKNLDLIDCNYRLGVDLSEVAIKAGRSKFPDLHLVHGDESVFKFFVDGLFDVSFTVSVLNHIPKIESIIDELQRVSRRLLVLESNDVWHRYCYPHNYEGFGFMDTGYRWASPLMDAEYTLYEWNGAPL